MTAPDPKRTASKPLLIGCSVAVVLIVLCAGVGLYFGTRGVRLFQAEVERAAEEEAFAQQWTAPAADATATTFAPESVAGYERVSSDENAAFPALGLDQSGSHAVYEKEGETVEVSVYRMTETEKTAVFDEVLRRIDDDDRFPSHSHVRLPRSLRFHVHPPDLHGLMWHAEGWLVFVRSQSVSDLEPFLRAYANAVEAGTDKGSPPGHESKDQPEPDSSEPDFSDPDAN